MKKLPLLCTMYFVLCIGTTFAYTSEDTSNANYLGDEQIIVKQSTASKYRLDDKILRQEVIGMALKVKGITLPENYTCKKYFADATKNDWVCRAVELAADNGIITRSNRYANPGKDVTQVEALAMIGKANNISFPTNSSRNGFDTDTPQWQIDVVNEVRKYGIWQPANWILYYEPLAKRSDVISFTTTFTLGSELPKFSNATLYSVQILPEKLSCARTEAEFTPGNPLCDSVYYGDITVYYRLFLKALREKDYENAVKYGVKLGDYENGFTENKYRLFRDSFVSMSFGSQSWGSVQFAIYTVKDNYIIRQLISLDGVEYQEWEKAIKTKFDLKDIYDTFSRSESEKKIILDFANQYWYDRFMEMEIQ